MGSKKVCRLCLNIIVGENFETLEEIKKGMLALILPKCNLNLKRFPNTICQKCSNCLHASYEFKSFCMEKAKQAKAAKKCCLCADDLQEIFDEMDVSLLNMKLEKCFPELVIPPCSTVCDNCRPMLEDLFTFVTGCLSADTKINDFPYLDVISDVEGLIDLYKIYEFYSHGKSRLNYVNEDGGFVDTKGSSRGVEGCVKAETVTEGAKAKRIKTEPACEEDNREFVFLKNEFECIVKEEKVDVNRYGETERNENDSLSLVDSRMRLSGDAEIKPFVDTFYDPETIHTAIENGPYQNASKLKIEDPDGRQVKPTENIEETIYQCKLCPYNANSKASLSKHMRIHKDASEVRTHRCKLCPYKTERKAILTRHMLIHKDMSEVVIYQCTLCQYKAKRKSDLSNHLLIHQDASEVTTYDCELCPYKTKRKGDLPKHMRTHKDTSEITAYNCKFCPYKARWKKSLIQHMLVHNDNSEVTTYQCKLCPYSTNWKAYLSRHMLIHKDASEVTTHQCELCSYKTKWKAILTRHMLVHKDISEVTTYQCNFCSYKAKVKDYLKKHMLTHQDSCEATTYQSNLCQYEIKRERDLSNHVLIHKDDSKVTTYQCKLCLYKTKWKAILTRHMLVHKDISEVRTYQCNLCSYKAKVKDYLKKHMLTHQDSSEVTTCQRSPRQYKTYKTKRESGLSRHALIHEDATEDTKSAQTQQGSVSQHQELEGCSGIKSEEVDIKNEEDDCADVCDKL